MRYVWLIVVAVLAIGFALTTPPSPKAGPSRQPSKVITYSGEGNPQDDLKGLVNESQIIVTGTVVALAEQYTAFREKETLKNIPDFSFPPVRSYRFAVEQVIKDEKDEIGRQNTIKVAYSAGADLNNVRYRKEGCPWLTPGARYLLFLTSPRRDAEGNILGMQVGGRWSICFRRGEYIGLRPDQGVVLLDGGLAVPNRDEMYVADPPTLRDAQIFGVTEDVAIANIKEAMAQD